MTEVNMKKMTSCEFQKHINARTLSNAGQIKTNQTQIKSNERVLEKTSLTDSK